MPTLSSEGFRGVAIAADLILRNARVLAMEPQHPRASFVAIREGRILGVGGSREQASFTDPRTKVVDCQSMTLIPGFHDAHCHLLALASSLLSLNCRPPRVDSIAQIKELVRKEALVTPPGRWIKAFGYDEQMLAERRHPTRRDLDEAAPFHPVRLDHRTGHAVVLNSQAMALLAISRDTPDPVAGLIQREEYRGEPTGLFLEMTSHIRRLMAPHRTSEEFLKGVAKANELLLSRGVTSVQDAGPDNDLGRWETFRRLKEGGGLIPRITMMVGYSSAADLLNRGFGPGSGDNELRIGAAKIMLTLTTGALQPDPEELRKVALRLQRRGFQLAFHAVEQEAVRAATDTLLEVQRVEPRRDSRHRVEHCSEAPPVIVEKLCSSGAVVVTQPGFIYNHGDRYLSLVDEELLPHLYPLASLTAASVPLAAGSDAPVSPPHPMLDLYAAVTRRSMGGRVVGPCQAIPAKEALKMWTLGGAYTSFQEALLGSIEAGKLADLVLLDRDPTQTPTEELKDIKVMMTLVGGKTVWEA